MSYRQMVLALLLLVTQNYIAQSHSSDLCTYQAETGLCKAYMPRYFYNRHTQQCEGFIYGGCGGNANNFGTIEECQATCYPSICSLPKEIGRCGPYSTNEAEMRFFYNSEAGECQRFKYSGCDGNANNFETMEGCSKMCECTQPKKVGRCKASMLRYYYNSANMQCERFYYGGCEANANNFRKKASCERTCE